jgi:carbon-monoxide dehydrogenase large subunit
MGTPCTHNPLGVKGCGEAGADRFAGGPDERHQPMHWACAICAMPATPERVWRALRQAA